MAMMAEQVLDFPSSTDTATEASIDAAASGTAVDAAFQALYAEHIGLVWRSLRGLGVSEASVEDAAQDVFLVVHRRLASFEERASLRTWLYGIVLRVARNYRRREQRKGGHASLDLAPEIADSAPGPHEEAATAEALRRLALLLRALDDQKREVFVLFELEQMSAPEIAEALGINVNTVSSRLRAARRAFEAAVSHRQGVRR